MREEEVLVSFQTLALPQGREESSRRVNDLREIIGYEFNDPMILQQAFTHHSYEEGCSSLDRLAYIGDAILTFAVTKDQCVLYPDSDPGMLTRLRSANVDTEKLARATLKLELHEFLRHNIFLLEHQIEEFREAIAKHPLHSSGLIDAPKVLADIFEALIGAIFLDCKSSFDTTWEVVKKLLEPVITPATLPIHPVSQLQELCQSRRLSLKMRDSWKDNGVVEFVINDACVGRAEYKAKRAIAKNRAALDAYNHLKCDQILL
ncbi:ribonuclease 3-like protein 3 isoform X1 [Salvia hispanica]|uniref:ribonuclease 3-like protein 3 isoform X1 n=1 Tax=Salvia hispanica TaxID=49212 RepID=UPI00200932DE|nr:ribonuclease 3-like protein 3 isoform X1 [Salvia hispanica]